MAHGIDRAFENVHLIRFPARAHVKPVPLVAAGAVHPELAVAVCTTQTGESGRTGFIVAYKHDVMAPVLVQFPFPNQRFHNPSVNTAPIAEVIIQLR